MHRFSNNISVEIVNNGCWILIQDFKSRLYSKLRAVLTEHGDMV